MKSIKRYRTFQPLTMSKFIYSVLVGSALLFILMALQVHDALFRVTRCQEMKQVPDIHRADVGQDQIQNQCKPSNRIFFLKVHKAGSSSVASVVQRFGLERDLNFVVPNRTFDAHGSNYIGNEGRLGTNMDIMKLPKGEEYHVLWNHIVYNRTAFRQIMPKDTKYFSIVRNPFDQFVSAFEYFGPGINVTDAFYDLPIAGHQNMIENFLQRPWAYELPGEVMTHTRNSLALDFGFTSNMLTEPRYRDEYIQQLDRDFSLVMLLEYFDESLVLLKRVLCWTTKDILYFHRNRNGFKHENLVFTREHRLRHKEIAPTDYKIYEYFRRVFWKKIWKMGAEFFTEVSYFKEILSVVYDYCSLNRTLYVAGNAWHSDFSVSWRDCHYMNSSEYDLYAIIYNKTLDRSHGD